MNEPQLAQLEREVEEARSRVVVDLARLRAPGAMAEFKEDVTAQVNRTKDQLLGGARHAVSERTDGIVSQAKARIAANPGAALAIGAGLAWKLYRHPPIAAVLIGAGIAGLVRADPRHPSMGADAAARAAELAGSASHRVQAKAQEWRDSDVPGQVSERAEEARRRMEELAQTANQRIGEIADAARRQMDEWRSALGGSGGKSSSRPVHPEAAVYAQPPFDAETPLSPEDSVYPHRAWAAQVPPPPPDRSAERDRYLLGAAAFAITAAVGFAAQRRFAQRDDDDVDDDVDPRSLPVPAQVYEKAAVSAENRPD